MRRLGAGSHYVYRDVRVELRESLVTAKAASAEKTKAGQSAKAKQRADAEKVNAGEVGPEVAGNVSHQLA
jgi:hypothetical protein